MFNHNQNLFFMVSYCFCLFGEFAKVFSSKESLTSDYLHSAARALSSQSRCFQLSTNIDKDFFRYLLCWDVAKIFTNTKRLLTSYVFLQHKLSEVLHCENEIAKEFLPPTKSKSLFEVD